MLPLCCDERISHDVTLVDLIQLPAIRSRVRDSLPRRYPGSVMASVTIAGFAAVAVMAQTRKPAAGRPTGRVAPAAVIAVDRDIRFLGGPAGPNLVVRELDLVTRASPDTGSSRPATAGPDPDPRMTSRCLNQVRRNRRAPRRRVLSRRCRAERSGPRGARPPGPCPRHRACWPWSCMLG